MHAAPRFQGPFKLRAVAYRPAGALSAKQILEREAAARRIITFCSDLDAILGGGVATGQITEFCE